MLAVMIMTIFTASIPGDAWAASSGGRVGGSSFRSSARSSYSRPSTSSTRVYSSTTVRPSTSSTRVYSSTTVRPTTKVYSSNTVRRPVIINNYGGGGYGYGAPFGGFHFGFGYSPFGGLFGGYPLGYSYGFGYNPAVTVGLSIADLLIRESER